MYENAINCKDGVWGKAPSIIVPSAMEGETMTTQYLKAAQEAAAQIQNLEGRIQRFTARGVRLERIPAIREEIARLHQQVKKLQATHRWSVEVYG